MSDDIRKNPQRQMSCTLSHASGRPIPSFRISAVISAVLAKAHVAMSRFAAHPGYMVGGVGNATAIIAIVAALLRQRTDAYAQRAHRVISWQVWSSQASSAPGRGSHLPQSLQVPLQMA